MVEMKSSQGTAVSVSKEKAQRLRASGYTDAEKAAPKDTVPKKRGRPKKTAEDNPPLEQILGEDESGG